jgi:putative hemolysin
LETEPLLFILSGNLGIVVKPLTLGIVLAFVVILILLFTSAIISGSEVAFFSLTPVDLNRLKKGKSKLSQTVVQLLNYPEKLLATILVANNFINVGIVIISSYISNSVFDFSKAETFGFFFQLIIITFLILFFGEILPKLYANRHAVLFSKFMARPLVVFQKIFWPVSYFLIRSTSFMNKRVAQKKRNLSINELSDALELTVNSLTEEKKILKGIVKFGNIDVKEIMKSRVDAVGADFNTRFNNLLSTIINSGYSRIPIYEESFDHIKGILYIKDLLPYLQENDDYNWQNLIRPPYYVPETKKINDLLKEFQTNKIHMAIVIDEYGGTSGIVTLEDILEEIVGEITDESDEEVPIYTMIDANNYLFDGKIMLNDFYKVLNTEENIFDDVKGEADTLAGLILEIRGEMPRKNDIIEYKYFTFHIKSVDTRRIKQILVNFKNIKPKDVE